MGVRMDTNYLEIADSLIREIRGEQSPQTSAAVAQAAALIAIAERLDTLIELLGRPILGDDAVRTVELR